jgi:ATP-dependent Clp protease protease subunit
MGIPYVIEKNDKGAEISYDLFSRLLKDRIIFISGEFNESMANVVTAQLLFLEMQDREADINMYINSPGGELTSLYAIFDTMNYIDNDIVTVGFGRVMSAASFILAAGTKGKRILLPNTEVMIHELSGGTEGKMTDMKISLEHALRLKSKMAGHYSEFTGQPVEKLLKDMERDFYMTSEEAVAYGLADKIQVNKKQ